ncbi:MAG: shikimate dehydrogenase family protein [bacterium]
MTGGRTYRPAVRPTLYFIGVTTGQSSIMKVFPEWAVYLKLGDCEIRGIDFLPHSDPKLYREAVSFIKGDPLSLGALVTTHKIDLLKACYDLFDELDGYAQLMGEVSCISKRGGKLIGHAKDPISSGLALEAFLADGYWEKTSGEVFVMGAGGSSIAITSYLLKREHGPNRPSRIIVSNRSLPRLEEMQRIHEKLGADVPRRYVHTPEPQGNDSILNKLSPWSLVINATGLGKDAPGSPITDSAVFPRNGIAWDFNYRGDLVFLKQARAQKEKRNLRIEDGWAYFVYGWTRAIAEIFHIEIPIKGPVFDDLSEIASRFRR